METYEEYGVNANWGKRQQIHFHCKEETNQSKYCIFVSILCECTMELAIQRTSEGALGWKRKWM